MPSMPSVGPRSMFGSEVDRTDAEAEALGFTGSPTILVDGLDLFGQRDAVVGLSCAGFTAPLKAPAHRALST